MIFKIQESVKIKPSQDTPLLYHNSIATVKSYFPKDKLYTVEVCGVSIKIDECFLEKV